MNGGQVNTTTYSGNPSDIVPLGNSENRRIFLRPGTDFMEVLKKVIEGMRSISLVLIEEYKNNLETYVNLMHTYRDIHGSKLKDLNLVVPIYGFPSFERINNGDEHERKVLDQIFNYLENISEVNRIIVDGGKDFEGIVKRHFYKLGSGPIIINPTAFEMRKGHVYRNHYRRIDAVYIEQSRSNGQDDLIQQLSQDTLIFRQVIPNEAVFELVK